MTTIIGYVISFLSGAVASLLPLYFKRRSQLKSIKKALRIEIDDIYEKSKSILDEFRSNRNSIPDNNFIRSWLQALSSSLPIKTPVIDSCYDKIDLIDEKTLIGLVKIRIYVDQLNTAINNRMGIGPLSSADAIELRDKATDILFKVKNLIDDVWR